MIALALALALASPLSERFWDRDLGGLARLLAEGRAAGIEPAEAPLFSDVLRLALCTPLEPLAADAPHHTARTLLRLEEARRTRLGDAAARSATIWRDVLSPGFFRLDAGNPGARRDLLPWPAETETWPAEVLLVAAPVSRCGAPPAARGFGDTPSADLVTALARDGDAEAASRLAYHRAVLLFRAGRGDEAAEAARAVAPEALAPELRTFARLLRLETGVDPAEGWAELEGAPDLGDAWLAAAVHAADAHARAGRWSEVLRIAGRGAAGACEGSRAAGVRALRFHRAVALSATRRADEVVSALADAFACPPPSPDPHHAALRDLALALVATRPLEEVSPLLAAMSPRAEGDLVFLYARRAAGAGNPDAAEAVARRLERARTAEGRLQALAVRADGAFARGDAAAFESALAALLEVGGRPRVRLERDRLALEILAAAAVRLADGPDRSLALALGRALDRVRQAVALRRIPEVDRLRLAALNAARAELAKPAKGSLPLALGEVAVPARRELPPLPVVGVEWPEPRSLLALPAGGATRDWFDDEELAQGSTP